MRAKLPIMLFCISCVLMATPLAAGERHFNAASSTPVLPPLLPWDGASRTLALAADSADPWITPAERSGLSSSPDYDTTIDWLHRLAAASAQMQMVEIGRSGEGRRIWMAVVSSDGRPRARADDDRPLVLVQAGIHAGEIDGKDAGMMLLRDLLIRAPRPELLESVDLLFIPVLNVDGHERRSPYGRINQRGPSDTGWRTNAVNLNLNRDYCKADSPEMRALLAVLERWQPDLYVDIHVTDGMDHQYDITWGGSFTSSPACGRWVAESLRPAVDGRLEAMGHVPGELFFATDRSNPDAGLYRWTAASPRFSDGYGNLRHLPTLLVENHALKPFDRRVLGTYVMLETVLATVGRDHRALRAARDADCSRRPAQAVLEWQVPQQAERATVAFKGISWRSQRSPVSSGTRIVWLGEPVDKEIPVVSPSQPAATVQVPAAYWIPPQWREVIRRLRLHGIELATVDTATEVEVELYRMVDYQLGDAPYEGRWRVQAGSGNRSERHRVPYPPGSVRVATDQCLGELAVHLLEPQAPDSFFQWGFFLSILNRTEYVEPYLMEAMAERMLAEDAGLAAAFEAALRDDPELAASPRQRLQWLYRRTPFFDASWRLYPVGRERTRH